MPVATGARLAFPWRHRFPCCPPFQPADNPKAMADLTSQPDVDKLVAEIKAGNDLAAQATQAIDAAAQQANEIAGDIPDLPLNPPAAASPGAAASPPADVQGATAKPAPSKEPFNEPIPRELQRLLAIEVPVIVQLGARRLTVGEVMRFSVGAIIEFNKAADEELDLLANNKPIGKGQAVKVGENFGIKISSISPVKETIRKLGGC